MLEAEQFLQGRSIEKEQERVGLQRRAVQLTLEEISGETGDSKFYGAKLAGLDSLLREKYRGDRLNPDFPDESLRELISLTDELTELFGLGLVSIYRAYRDATERRTAYQKEQETKKLQFDTFVLGK